MSNISRRIPKLRFSGFSGEWQNIKFEDIANFSKGKNISKEETSENGVTAAIRYGELYTRYKEVIKEIYSRTNIDSKNLVFGKSNDVIMPASGESNIDIATASCLLLDNVALGGDINIIRTSNSGVFISYYINNMKKYEIARLAQGNSVVHLYSSQLKGLLLNIPSFSEQVKIAEFLEVIDRKISILDQKYRLTEKYKKGIMQLIFSQKISFKDESGKPYPVWQEKPLSSFLVERGDGAPKSNQYPLMAFIAYKGVSQKGDRYNREFLVNNDEKKYKKTEYGDFIYSSNNLETGSIGLNKYGSASISPVYSIFKISETCDTRFIGQYLLRKSFISKMIRYRQGVVYGQWKIHESEFLKIKERIPSYDEQKKISELLHAIDEKIEAEESKLEQIKSFKNGLLQQMFI